MGYRRSMILCHRESLVHARPGDLIVTDISDVLEAASSEGIQCVDLREVLSGSEDYIDTTVASWRSFIDRLESPRAAGVPFIGCLRGELIWEVFVPFARYLTAAREIAGSTSVLATDAAPGGPRRAAIDSVAGEGAVIELPPVPVPRRRPARLKRDPLLPPSHGSVEFGSYSYVSEPKTVAKSLAVSTLSRTLALLDRRRSRRHPSVVYGHYRTLGEMCRELSRRYRLILWPWAYPRRKDILVLAANGAATIPVPPPSAALGESFPGLVDPENRASALEEAVAESIPDRSFSIQGIDVTGALVSQISRTTAEYLDPLATRLAAARRAVDRMGVDCVVIPNDTSLEFAPLARIAAARGVPVVVVAHGVEGSRVPGDKRLASDVLVWSDAMAEDLQPFLEDTGAETWVSGPPHLESLCRSSPPAHGSILFLSYAVRHNTAWDSWMDAERYLELLSQTVGDLGDRLRVVGLKIHPSEDAEYYRTAMRRAGLEVPLLEGVSVHESLADAAIVAGPISTGLAEAYWLGSIPVCVNLSGGPLPAPCDGSTEIPVVTRAEALGDLLSEWLDGDLWAGWTTGDWPAFARFVGSPHDAGVRAAAIVEKVIE